MDNKGSLGSIYQDLGPCNPLRPSEVTWRPRADWQLTRLASWKGILPLGGTNKFDSLVLSPQSQSYSLRAKH
eukprot:1190162-Prorocentrum_minimum.AAC.3